MNLFSESLLYPDNYYLAFLKPCLWKLWSGPRLLITCLSL